MSSPEEADEHVARVLGLLPVIRAALADPAASLATWRVGTDFGAYLATSRGRRYVVRVPRHERLLTSYEGEVDFGVVMQKEVVVQRLLRQAGVPVPELIAHDASRTVVPWSWMLSSYADGEVPDSLTPGAARSLGRLARRIHELRPLDPELRVGSVPWSAFIVTRILQRLRAASAYTALPGDEASWRAALEARLALDIQADRLLHLDLRASNVHCQGDTIVALLDYANAIVGDPVFELARVKAGGNLTPAFLAGYGLTQEELEEKAPVLDAYVLDTSALLVAVSREEIDDPPLFERMSSLTVSTLRGLLE